MKVVRRFGNKLDRPGDDPLLEAPGFWWELRSGDVCHPVGAGNWLKPPYFTRAWRWFCKWPVLPFISWNFGKRGGYAGFKIYGVDHLDEYQGFVDVLQIYPGSQAMHMSIRPFASMAKQ